MEQDHLARYEFACTYARGKRVLDIACGTGYGTAHLADCGAVSVDGADLADDAVRYAQNRFHRPNTRFHRGDICLFQNGSPYDLIVSFETIEHVITEEPLKTCTGSWPREVP